MSVNMIELIDSVISDAQTLLNELGQDEKLRQRMESLLKAAQDIQAELVKYAAADGSITDIPQSSGYYTRTPFAIFDTGTYVLTRFGASGKFAISTEQLARVETMAIKVKSIMDCLYKIWGVA